MFGVHQQAGQCAGADLAQVLKFDAGRDEFIARGRVIQQSQPRTRRALRAATFAKRGERVAYLQIEAVDDTAGGGFEKAKTNIRNVLPNAAAVARAGAFDNGHSCSVAEATSRVTQRGS